MELEANYWKEEEEKEVDQDLSGAGNRNTYLPLTKDDLPLSFMSEL